MKLYRYIPALDKRSKEEKLYERMVENLKQARLNFTNPATLNDPLEAIIPYSFKKNGITVPPNTEEIKKMLSTQLGEGIWETQRGKRILETLPFGIPLEHALMLSLSKSRDNQLMWAHYADYHKGICMEFEFPDNFCAKVEWSNTAIFAGKRYGLACYCGDVNYGTQRKPIVFSDRIAEDDYLVYDALLSKPNCWKYEREYRILLYYPIDGECKFAAGADTHKYYLTYPKEWLTGITFGMRLSREWREKIATYIREANYPNVTFREEILEYDKFEIGSKEIRI